MLQAIIATIFVASIFVAGTANMIYEKVKKQEGYEKTYSLARTDIQYLVRQIVDNSQKDSAYKQNLQKAYMLFTTFPQGTTKKDLQNGQTAISYYYAIARAYLMKGKKELPICKSTTYYNKNNTLYSFYIIFVNTKLGYANPSSTQEEKDCLNNFKKFKQSSTIVMLSNRFKGVFYFSLNYHKDLSGDAKIKAIEKEKVFLQALRDYGEKEGVIVGKIVGSKYADEVKKSFLTSEDNIDDFYFINLNSSKLLVDTTISHDTVFTTKNRGAENEK